MTIRYTDAVGTQWSRPLAAALVLLLPLLPYSSATAGVWTQFGANAARSRAVADRAITARNAPKLRLRWHTHLGSIADSEPVALESSLFITAKDGTTYALDASNGHIRWRFETHGPGITTSSPALNPSNKTLFAAGLDGYVHEIAVATGKEIRSNGFPAQITLIPDTEKNASSLTIANGFLYAATSGYFGDAPPYDGHVVAVRLSDGTKTVFNTLCSDRRMLLNGSGCNRSGSGIWARGGVVVDPDPSMHGRIYATTGNGDFNAGGGGHDYGDSIVSLTADATKLVDSYTPESYAELDSGDTDLGSSSPVLLPREPRSRTPLMLAQGGKDAILRLLDRAHLGGVGHELQRIDLGTELFSTPAVWQSNGETWIYLGLPDGVRAFRLETSAGGTSRLHDAWSQHMGSSQEGTSPAVASGVVFVAMSGALYALDASTGKPLWNSAQESAGGTIGPLHWQSPMVANGFVYCADENGDLSAYGLR